jgi:hypothetical protein
MLRDTSAASTRRRSTLSAADAAAGNDAEAAKINARSVLMPRIRNLTSIVAPASEARRR